MKKFKLAVVGAGSRGYYTYSRIIAKHYDDIEFVAVSDIDEYRQQSFAKEFNIPPENVFGHYEEFFKAGKLADAVIIGLNDDIHYIPTKLALENGYDILLEKPMTNTAEDCVNIIKLCEEYPERSVTICHVLRYTVFFKKLKEIIESQKLGKLKTIVHNENIQNFHFAHSFVRGNWRNSDETSPLILAKSCHDLDIIKWLVGDTKCDKVSSFGDLTYFNESNFTDEMSDRCVDCKLQDTCMYSATKYYNDENTSAGWKRVVINKENSTKEEVNKILETSQYGRCVFKCDNNVVDSMVSILRFENKVTASFNLSAFTKDMDRTIKLMFEHGEVRGIMEKNEIEIRPFDGPTEVLQLNQNNTEGYKGHGGGDDGLIENFVNTVFYKKGEIGTSARESFHSHMMCFALEKARVTENVVTYNDFLKEYNI